MITVAALSKLTFSGLALLLWVLLPVFWFTRGPEVNRHGEDFWQIHARNVFATQRANSIIATTDHQRLLAPWLVLQKNEDIRTDLLAVDPTRLHLTGYLETLNLEEIISDPELLGLMAVLQAAIDKDDVPLARSTAAHFFLEWTRNAIEVPEIGGVLLSNELSLDDNFQLIPDGLLWRVWNGRTNHPFLFAGLDLGPVYVRDDATPLMIQTIQLYPDMFTRRATWLGRESWTVLASDYVKWSLRIDPTHVQARLLQEEFGVHGDPLYLRPKRPPRVRRGLEGVSE